MDEWLQWIFNGNMMFVQLLMLESLFMLDGRQAEGRRILEHAEEDDSMEMEIYSEYASKYHWKWVLFLIIGANIIALASLALDDPIMRLGICQKGYQVLVGLGCGMLLCIGVIYERAKARLLRKYLREDGE